MMQAGACQMVAWLMEGNRRDEHRHPQRTLDIHCVRTAPHGEGSGIVYTVNTVHPESWQLGAWMWVPSRPLHRSSIGRCYLTEKDQRPSV